MKKLATLILSAALMASVSVSASTETEMISYENSGVDFAKTAELQTKEGVFDVEGVGAIDGDHHVYMFACMYFATARDKYEAACRNDESISDEEFLKIVESRSIFDIILATDKDLDAAREAHDAAYGNLVTLNYDEAEEIAAADGYTFYSVPAVDAGYTDKVEEKYADEYEAVKKALPAALKESKFYAPVDAVKEMIGQKIDFTSTDLDGNTVSTKELFAKNKITMVNFWGTWCPNCMNEMEELEKLHEKMQEKGCGLVAIDFEQSNDEATLNKAKKVLKGLGITYPNIMINDEWMSKIQGYPTSIFVDSEGTIIATPIVGAAVDLYEPTFEALLNE
ncbi:MAG: TlpA family protein disulfide reductase [Blautia sp.]|nr:TlpA family protein disulfide reductase [Blautia sp.]